MNNREAFEVAVKECGDEEKFAKNMQLSLACYAYFIHGVNAALASQAQQTESKPALKVVNGEICYRSTDDDQSYGMWCPVSYDTKHGYREGTKFIAIPPAPEGDKPCEQK